MTIVNQETLAVALKSLRSGDLDKAQKIAFLVEHYTPEQIIDILDQASNGQVSKTAFNPNWKDKKVYFVEKFNAFRQKGNMDKAYFYKTKLKKLGMEVSLDEDAVIPPVETA